MKNEIILEKTPQQIEAIEKETRRFNCPCCGVELAFRTCVHITSVGIPLDREEMARLDGCEVSLSPADREKRERVIKNAELLRVAKETGVFDSFNAALEAGANHIPRDRDAYFVKWIERAHRQKTPQFALRQCLEEKDLEADGELELWGHQYVSAVLSNKEFKVFIPTQLVKGEVIEKLEYSPNGIKTQYKADLTIWIRTRFGYVAKSKEFSNELRRHSIGSFQV